MMRMKEAPKLAKRQGKKKTTCLIAGNSDINNKRQIVENHVYMWASKMGKKKKKGTRYRK